MLVVDHIELTLLYQPEDVRELHGDHAVRLEEEGHPAYEVVQSGHVGKYVVADEEILPRAAARSLRAVAAPKNSTIVGMPFRRAASATLAAGLMPRAGCPGR